MARGRRWLAARIGTAIALGIGLGVGCSDPCCFTDEFPINLVPGPAGDSTGLLARAQVPNGDPTNIGTEKFQLSIDTGTALTLFRRSTEPNQLTLRDFDILDAQPPAAQMNPVVRGRFHQIEVLPTTLDPAGPDAVLGGAFLQNFSVEFDFAKPAMTLWARLGPSDGFLDAGGFAVLHFSLFGGAELTAESRPDFLGLTGPVEIPSTRVVLRTCAVPDVFDPNTPEQARCCKRGDEVALATGANLALMVATGVGPLVLSQAAWNRIATAQVTSPLATPIPGPALSVPGLPAPLTNVGWSTIPRIALVNQEASDATNPGACVELGRARRLEWIERHQSDDGATGACVLPCDTDPRDTTMAQNAAAYVEIGDDIRVAVVPDGTPLLQGLRAEIRPEGPEIDGLIGANVFIRTTVEIDYRSKPGRAVIACVPDALRSSCFASPRCPRLSNPGDVRACFGMRPRALPLTCDVSVCG